MHHETCGCLIPHLQVVVAWWWGAQVEDARVGGLSEGRADGGFH
jgi:hypothetical protein